MEHPEKMHARVALLIDADNISSEYAEVLFKHAASYGNVIIRKAYGTLRPGFPWGKDHLHKYGIEPVARHTHRPGKNITDIALVIDAMDLMHRKVADAFCLASVDSDFSLLAMRLRQQGVKVYGFGDSRAMASFTSSCDEFFDITPDNVRESPGQTSEPHAASASSREISAEEMEKIVINLAAACEEYGDHDGWAFLAPVGSYLQRVAPDCTAKNKGFKTLTEMVEKTGQFEVKLDAGNPQIRRKGV